VSAGFETSGTEDEEGGSGAGEELDGEGLISRDARDDDGGEKDAGTEDGEGDGARKTAGVEQPGYEHSGGEEEMERGEEVGEAEEVPGVDEHQNGERAPERQEDKADSAAGEKHGEDGVEEDLVEEGPGDGKSGVEGVDRDEQVSGEDHRSIFLPGSSEAGPERVFENEGGEDEPIDGIDAAKSLPEIAGDGGGMADVLAMREEDDGSAEDEEVIDAEGEAGEANGEPAEMPVARIAAEKGCGVEDDDHDRRNATPRL